MKNNITNIIKDLKKLLDDYMTEAASREFIRKLQEDNFANNDESDFSELDKSQVQFEVPTGIDHRVMVDKMITQCENDLTEEKFYNLLLDLSQLMLYRGEVAFSLSGKPPYTELHPHQRTHRSRSARFRLYRSQQ